MSIQTTDEELQHWADEIQDDVCMRGLYRAPDILFNEVGEEYIEWTSL
jgi:hypothetical protein